MSPVLDCGGSRSGRNFYFTDEAAEFRYEGEKRFPVKSQYERWEALGFEIIGDYMGNIMVADVEGK